MKNSLTDRKFVLLDLQKFFMFLSFFFFFHLDYSLPSGMSVGRSNIKQVADKRRADIEKFLLSLFKMAPEISQSDLVYTFFHPLLRDQQNADIHLRKVKGIIKYRRVIRSKFNHDTTFGMVEEMVLRE